MTLQTVAAQADVATCIGHTRELAMLTPEGWDRAMLLATAAHLARLSQPANGCAGLHAWARHQLANIAGMANAAVLPQDC